MKVLIACEKSGVGRRAFARRGHEVWSCDTERAEDGSNRHIIDDVRNVLNDGWDLLMVAHPPCTRLCNSGVRWLSEPPPGKTAVEMQLELEEGTALFSACWNAPIDRIAVENPIMHKHAKKLIVNYAPPAQTVQPWWFGHPVFKATSFFLKGLLPLVATNKLTPPKPGTDEHKAWSVIHRASPGPDRSTTRSRSFDGMLDAAADQWGGQALEALAAV